MKLRLVLFILAVFLLTIFAISILWAAPPPFTGSIYVSCGPVCEGNAFAGTGDPVSLIGVDLPGGSYDVEMTGPNGIYSLETRHPSGTSMIIVEYIRVPYLDPGTYHWTLYKHQKNVPLAATSADVVVAP